MLAVCAVVGTTLPAPRTDWVLLAISQAWRGPPWAPYPPPLTLPLAVALRLLRLGAASWLLRAADLAAISSVVAGVLTATLPARIKGVFRSRCKPVSHSRWASCIRGVFACPRETSGTGRQSSSRHLPHSSSSRCRQQFANVDLNFVERPRKGCCSPRPTRRLHGRWMLVDV